MRTMQTTSYVMPPSLRDEIAALAAKEGLSASQYVRRILIKHIDGLEKRKAKRK